MMLLHTAGTVGGMTASGAAFVIGAGTVASHASIWADVVITVAGTVGAFVALLSYWTGRKSDPKAALIAHAALDDQRNFVIDQRLTDINQQLDTLVTHFLGNPPTKA